MSMMDRATRDRQDLDIDGDRIVRSANCPDKEKREIVRTGLAVAPDSQQAQLATVPYRRRPRSDDLFGVTLEVLAKAVDGASNEREEEAARTEGASSTHQGTSLGEYPPI